MAAMYILHPAPYTVALYNMDYMTPTHTCTLGHAPSVHSPLGADMYNTCIKKCILLYE